MSVWVLHQPVGAEEEAQITQRLMLMMPWQGIPNLGGIHQQPELRKLIAQMMPDAPPETITLRTQVVWKGFSELQKEDIIAVPLPQGKRLALAEITGVYHYQPASVGKAATHSYPVKWFSKTAPLSRFGKDADILTDELRAQAEAFLQAVRGHAVPLVTGEQGRQALALALRVGRLVEERLARHGT